MKINISISILILLFALTTHAFSQADEIVITEGSTIEICGHTIAVDGLWIDNFELKADISVYLQKNSKPITGGYKAGDTIIIADGCEYPITFILKYGLNSKGKVVLSNSSNIREAPSFRNTFSMRQNQSYFIGDELWILKEVFKDSAKINIRKDNLILRSFYLKLDDVVWRGKYAFSVSDFTASGREKDRGSIDFKIVKDFSYLSGPIIPGELINPPAFLPASRTELIIRKMKYYPKKRIDEEELKNTPVKYWVLKIFYYPRGIASMVIDVERNGEKLMVEFEGYKSFDTKEEVMEFARINKITDIKLE